ncbi:MAG TPA: T9SS type A sorting domain-containing protein [Cryomorphaceae bacterium]|nr:T9SS type A sorting domain-containing protein [Cryomorphaceae bacterium]
MKTNTFKKISVILVAVLLCSLSVSAQETISMHSITTDRQPLGDTGYTLDGFPMSEARLKLLSTANFGSNGTYEKSIEITDGYAQSGDLESITSAEGIDLFYFGMFNSSEASLAAFTQAELDSLYEWSLNGGKLIIGAASDFPDFNFAPDVLNDLWGFDLALESPTSIIPTADGVSTLLFDGPFGEVTQAFQGGSSQGYFNALPEDVVVLADNVAGDPTVILDCTTLDMIVADGDAYSFLGQISQGNQITSQNDIFWANTIAFMDDLEDPPLIVQNGDMLSVGSYLNYQWFLDGTPLEGQNESSIVASDNGIYSVEVDMECGCTKTDSIELTTLSTEQEAEFGEIELFPNPVQRALFFTTAEQGIDQVEIYDAMGRKIHALNLRIAPSLKGAIDVHSFDRGHYIIVFFENGAMIDRQKFLKW